MCYRNKLVLKKNQSGLTILGLTIAYSFISLFYLLMTLLCSFSGITNDNSHFYINLRIHVCCFHCLYRFCTGPYENVWKILDDLKKKKLHLGHL